MMGEKDVRKAVRWVEVLRKVEEERVEWKMCNVGGRGGDEGFALVDGNLKPRLCCRLTGSLPSLPVGVSLSSLPSFALAAGRRPSRTSHTALHARLHRARCWQD